VATDVLTWDEERALDACHSETRGLLDAWAAAGRIGEQASAWIAQSLPPAGLDDALSRTQLDEPPLPAWISSLQTALDDDTIAVITAWRASGLPGNPPPGANRYIDRDPGRAETWRESGFDLYAASKLELAGLATATRWRSAGCDEGDTYELLRSD
jgi:hypothetical protein